MHVFQSLMYTFAVQPNTYIMAIINVILIQSVTGVVSDHVSDKFWTMKAADDFLSVLGEADCEITEKCPIMDLVMDNTYDWYVIEAHTENLSYIAKLFTLELVSKITVYTVPVVDYGPLHLLNGICEKVNCRCQSTRLLGDVVKTVYTLD